MISIGSTATTAVKSCEAVFTSFFCVNITFTKLITDLRMCDSLIHISHKELLFTNKLMTVMQTSPVQEAVMYWQEVWTRFVNPDPSFWKVQM